MNQKALVIQDLSKTYTVKKNKTKILQNISLDVDKNEIISIMGPSGCGKSVLLKIIAGIERPSDGKLKIFGKDCTDYMDQGIKKRLGFIYQDSNLLPWRSVEKNLRVPLEIFGLQKEKEYLERISEALDIVGLQNYRDALPQELSGGMMQRVGIARALVFNPDILLMDQPFGALDALTRAKLRVDFLKIIEKTQKTIIIVTNSIDEALLFSKRIYIMSERPATFIEIVDVDVPYELRDIDINVNPYYKDLRIKLIKTVKEQYSQKKCQTN